VKSLVSKKMNFNKKLNNLGKKIWLTRENNPGWPQKRHNLTKLIIDYLPFDMASHYDSYPLRKI
jgi:hypothetical protein